jgi:endonuclease IV
VNYIGSLNEENRSKGLRQLKELLNKIIEKWPEVEFMTSPQLGETMQTKKSSIL